MTAAEAAPIKPDIERLVREAQEPEMQFAPARAGWNGPENAAAPLAPSLALDTAYRARLVRASVLEAVTPEPRILAALLVLIVLLRRFHQEKQPAGVEVMPRRERHDPPLQQAA